MSDEICIIDYKAGNGRSVLTAFEHIGARARLVARPQLVHGDAALVLPGVGAARAAMDSLCELGWTDALKERVLVRRVPFLGICVGMQILFEYSSEGDTECLGFIKGHVQKFPYKAVRVPQMGWNLCQFLKKPPVLDGLSSEEYMYFVNSYHVVPSDPQVVLARTQYGVDFCSMLAHQNILATQFHPEKSGEAGLRLLQNFAKEAGCLC